MRPIVDAMRLLAAIAVVALMQSAGSGSINADDVGRDFSRCVQQCNEVRVACHERCQVDCAVDFEPGSEA